MQGRGCICAAGIPTAKTCILLQVPLINVGQPVNESTMSFAISSWSEIAYHDPSLVQYNFKIAEDLIYDVTNDTFAGGGTCMLNMYAVLIGVWDGPDRWRILV